MDNANEKPLLPVRSMARHLGVPMGWLKAEAEAGRVPSLKTGKTHIFHPPSVIAALSKRAAGKGGTDAR